MTEHEMDAVTVEEARQRRLRLAAWFGLQGHPLPPPWNGRKVEVAARTGAQR